METFPQTVFTSTTVRQAGQTSLELIGDLTIKGVTNTITLPLALAFEESPLIRSATLRVGFEGALTINRKDGAGFLPDPLHPPRCPADCYGGGSADLPADALQNYLDRIASGVVSLGHSNSHRLEDFRQAHSDLENNRAVGKCVVLTYPKRVKALMATCPRSCAQTVGEALHGF